MERVFESLTETENNIIIQNEVKDMNKINLKLKARIIQLYGSQLMFSQKIGVTELFVSRVVTNRQKLTPEKKKIWAEALACKPEDIF